MTFNTSIIPKIFWIFFIKKVLLKWFIGSDLLKVNNLDNFAKKEAFKAFSWDVEARNKQTKKYASKTIFIRDKIPAIVELKEQEIKIILQERSGHQPATTVHDQHLVTEDKLIGLKDLFLPKYGMKLINVKEVPKQ